jgi:hypothetical protein
MKRPTWKEIILEALGLLIVLPVFLALIALASIWLSP